jgi:hypothetical protein
MEKNSIKVIFMSFLIFLITPIFSQGNKIKLTEVSISYGIQSDFYDSLNFQDFKSIAPNSTILMKDFSTFEIISNHSISKLDNPFITREQRLLIGFKLSKFKNGLFRIGLNNLKTTNQFSTSAFQSSIIGHDTVYTSQGTPVYIDIYRSKSLYATSNSKKILLDLSYTYSLPEEHQMVMYSGFGLNVGMSYQSKISTSYFEHVGVAGSSSAPSTTVNNHEDLKLKPYFSSTIYVPIGLNIKLGKKSDFMKHIHIFGEIRPAISFLNFPSTRTIFLVSGNANLGIKLKL